MAPKVITSVIGVILFCMASQAMGYKHIIFMHGILAGPSEFDYYNQLVQQYHPGTPSTQINLYNHKDSIVDMWTQVVKIADTVRPILLNTSSEGTILVCFSQGGLICRALLATINHNVQTFISLSAPLAGQYGDSEYLKYFFPNLLKENAYKLFYTPMGQDVSIGGYWNDPRQQKMFKEFSNFLAVLNNQSTVVNPKSQEFRSNFLRLKNLVLVGGPDDGVITPWESSQFGMYNATDAVLPMEEQEWYQNDAFGLQTMNTQGRILKFVFKGIQHRHWHSELQVFEKCIKPWL